MLTDAVPLSPLAALKKSQNLLLLRPQLQPQLVMEVKNTPRPEFKSKLEPRDVKDPVVWEGQGFGGFGGILG